MSLHPVVVNPVLNPVVAATDPVRWRAGRLAPDGAILHWDADIDAFAEQTGGVHKFNHAVLSPQYQRNADGSYSNVGAKPAVDVFDGQKWLRSCGAVTNLLPSGSENFASGWTAGFVSVSAASGWYKIEETADSQSHSVTSQNITPVAGSSYTARVHLKAAERGFAFVGFIGAATIFVSVNLSTGVVSVATGSPVSYSAEAADGGWVVYITVVLPTTTVTKLDVRTSFDGVWANRSYIGVLGSGILVRSPILTATAYPVPYVPPGVTQPASNATTTNGSWFTLPQYLDAETSDGQWKRDGVELVTNGGFDSATGWVVTAPSTITAGEAKISSTGLTAPVQQDINAIVLGQRYNIKADYRLVSGSIRVQLGSGAGVSGTYDITTIGTGKIDVNLTWSGTDKVVFLNRATACEGYFDNISIQKLIPATSTSELWQALDGKPDGVELVTNAADREFSSDTGYWGRQANWAISSGSFNATATIGAFHKSVDPAAVVGGRYLVQFDINNYVGGTFRISWGGTTTTFNAPGRYAKIITLTSVADKNIYFNGQPGSPFTGSIDNISIQRIQPQPLTLATRVRMGVGSGDILYDAKSMILNCNISTSFLYYGDWVGVKWGTVSYDGTRGIQEAPQSWNRNTIIRRFVQVNTAGTQFRVGYMVEGAHTTIQWSVWFNFDGSFNPTTLYRLLLGYNNAYPMWFNKVTVWKKQATDAEILEAMA